MTHSQLDFDHFRSDWVDPDAPVTGPAFYWWRIREIAIHYPGCDCDNIPDGDFDEPWSEFPEYMRSMHNAYLRRGYSVGYNVVGDARGHDWEARGDTYSNAANVGRKFDWNRNYDTISYKFVVDQADAATSDAAAAFRRFVVKARAAAGRHLPYRPHSYYDWTACPGDGIKAQIEAGVFEPIEPEPAPPPSPPINPIVGVLDMTILSREINSQTIWFSPNGGLTRHGIRNLDQLELLILGGALDAKTGKQLVARGADESWKQIGELSRAGLNARLGAAA